MSEEVAVRRLAPGESLVEPESAAALAAQRIMRKKKAPIPPAATPPAPVELEVDDTPAVRARPGRGAKRCGRCGGDWISKNTGRAGSYERICVGCNLEVRLCSCPPIASRIQKNAAHVESRNKNQRAVRAAAKPAARPGLKCPGCGGAVEVRGKGTGRRVYCIACGKLGTRCSCAEGNSNVVKFSPPKVEWSGDKPPRGGATAPKPPAKLTPRPITTDVQMGGIRIEISIDIPSEQLQSLKRSHLETLLDGIAMILEAKGGQP